MGWTVERIVERFRDLSQRGHIGVPPRMFRNDDGVVGQLLELEFDLAENNLALADLGQFELKGMRKRSSTLTLCHKTPISGMKPLEIFDRYGYVRASNRNQGVMKKKFFSTITGNRFNSRKFRLAPLDATRFQMVHETDGTIATWDLVKSLPKVQQIVLGIAETEGTTNSANETFHYVELWLMQGLRSLDSLIRNGVIKMDLCIDQPIDGTRPPHDRGPHIRIPKSQFKNAYESVTRLFP